jgi:hypothetical protein
VLEAGEIATVDGQSSGRPADGLATESSSLQEVINLTGQATGVTA